MATSSVKTDRLSCRIAPEHKRLLERAAARHGLSVTDYLVSTALQIAQDELLAEEPIRLSAADWEQLIAIIENPPAASPDLVQAMARFNKGELDTGRDRT
ncbi:MAG: type II toxin-antitoxin system TacA family antitoxin [Armatimonadota bacterium]